MFTPEVMFNNNIDIIFDNNSNEDWEEPTEEQIEDEDKPESLLRKKLHIQQVRAIRSDREFDSAFVCSKTNIQRDYIVFFGDDVVYGDLKHSNKVCYQFVKGRIGDCIKDPGIAIEMIKRHNAIILSYLPIDLRILRNADLIEVAIAKYTDEVREDIIGLLSALIYTEDDELII